MMKEKGDDGSLTRRWEIQSGESMVLKKYAVLTGCLFSILIFSPVFADHHKNRERHQGKHVGRHVPPANNETYKQQCGACHLAYQAWLLPSGSWEKLLAQLPSHFGTEVEIDADSKRIIEGYLQSNATVYSDGKRSWKAIKAAADSTPLRITETRYFRQKHHELNSSIFARRSIGSPSNCLACHTTAEQGVYEEDSVKIPE